jgi:two-component system chemotaxis response regulator CheB
MMAGMFDPDDAYAPLPLPIRPAVSRILVLGASTGGTEAIKEVLLDMPPTCPPIVIAQHMPENFTHSFATRLDNLCAIRVKEAEHGEPILSGHAYLAPGHSHLMVRRNGSGYQCELAKTDPVNRHRPSVDVLFRSAARHAGRHAIGVILTGMGKDGAAGMREMREAGAYNFAQNEQSCVVFGMPREAVALGAVDEVVPLPQIAKRILEYLHYVGEPLNT